MPTVAVFNYQHLNFILQPAENYRSARFLLIHFNTLLIEVRPIIGKLKKLKLNYYNIFEAENK